MSDDQKYRVTVEVQLLHLDELLAWFIAQAWIKVLLVEKGD
jgi:hypothetical protein